jgi:hypothetical protein
MSSDNMPRKGLAIIKGVMLDFVKQFTGAASVTFTAKDAMTGQLIYLNGKKSLTMKASSVRGQKFTIFATTKPGHISTGEFKLNFLNGNAFGTHWVTKQSAHAFLRGNTRYFSRI